VKTKMSRNSSLPSRGKVRASGGNVFADVRLASPDEFRARAELAHEICELIVSKQLNQIQAARLLGIDQPKVSTLMRGRLSGFSTERLLRFLNALDRDVLIVIRPSPSRRHGALRVVAEA
jgi:predicted XRE-type DNA-binding protein